MGDVILISHSLFLQGDRIHGRCREKLELCRIKRIGSAKYTCLAKQGGHPLVYQELCYGVSIFSALQTADLPLPVWQNLMAHLGSRQALFQVYQQILAAPFRNNATERQQVASCGLGLLHIALH